MEKILIPIAVGVVALVLGAFVGFLIRKKIGEAKIGSAEAEAKRILEEGSKSAETKKKEALLEAKDEMLRLRNETERELKERRAEVSRQERRINQKEENLDKKSESLERKNEQLDEKLKANDALREQIQSTLASHLQKLEEISKYTVEQTKAELLARVESETR
jgi:ribonuclease Y